MTKKHVQRNLRKNGAASESRMRQFRRRVEKDERKKMRKDMEADFESSRAEQHSTSTQLPSGNE